MEEIEPPLETVQEHIHETAAHARETWIGRVALFSALVAALAAVAALLAGHHSNEAMILQIKASDKWSYYQAKGIKSAVLSAKTQLLLGLNKTIDAADLKKLEDYKKDQDEISEQAKTFEEDSEHHLRSHQVLARAVTMFQVAIAIAAISVLTRRRRYWFVGIIFSILGLTFFVQGLWFV